MGDGASVKGKHKTVRKEKRKKRTRREMKTRNKNEKEKEREREGVKRVTRCLAKSRIGLTNYFSENGTVLKVCIEVAERMRRLQSTMDP